MRKVTVVSILAFAWTSLAYGQSGLDQNCTVAVLNRTTPVRADGSWVIPNIPANFGAVRARATCLRNGVTTYGESALFTLSPNGSINIPPIQLGSATPIPTGVVITAPTNQLTNAAPTVQLTVTANYAGGIASRNVTAASTGTIYNISNPAIATISTNGLVTARSSGTVLIQAIQEGTQGLFSIQIALTGDSDSDGIPDDVETSNNLNPRDPADATADFDGDGLSNRRELMETGTNIRLSDTDGDGLNDGVEVNGTNGFRTNPLLADTDGDSVRDALEISLGTNPLSAASVNLNGAISSVAVTPSTFTLLVNAINPNAFTQLNVRGTMSDGTIIDLTPASRGTTYATSNVNVCNFGGVDGRVFAGAEGPCTITVVAAGRTVQVSGAVRTFTPVPLSQISIPGYANNVEAVGNFAYVAAGSAGLQIVNFSDPAAPVIAGSRDTGGTAIDVRVRGDFAYIADGGSGLSIINIATPTNPQVIGTVDTPGNAEDVFVAGNFAYIADGGSGLTILNITNPAAPILVSTTNTGGTAHGVWSDGEIAVVVSEGATHLKIYNVTNTSQPVLRGTVNLNGAKDVDVNGTFAVVAGYSGGSHLVNIANPSAPLLVDSLPGSDPNGLVARDVVIANNFVVFAEQLFPNAVVFGDIASPNDIAFRGILNFSGLGDYAGTGIAVRGPYVLMTGESFVVSQDFGSFGDTRLFIGQYLPVEDRAGVPPTVTLTAVPGGGPRIQGERMTLSSNADDDVTVVSVTFRVNGAVAFVDTSAPYEYVFNIPEGINSLNLQAIATDLGGNQGNATPLTIQVIPDPLTTVRGRVLNELGQPRAGASVTVTGGLTGVTGADGVFAIPGVSTISGPVSATASATINDVELTGASASFEPVRGAITQVGDIQLISARWESNYGPCWSRSDDTFTQVALPFTFPFYGSNRNNVFVGTNGYVTFNSGDSEYVENVPQFNLLPRISAFFDDLYGRSQGCTHYNGSIPGRFVVTYDRVQHFNSGGSFTLQIILFQDGRIQFGYRGLTHLGTGAITGITPGPNSPPLQVNFSDQPSIDVPAGSNVFEYFNSDNPFDIDNSFIIFTPQGGGYRVRTIRGVQAPEDVDVDGGPGTPVLTSAGSESAITIEVPLTLAKSNRNEATGGSRAATAADIADAEVEITASSNVRYRGMTNTDRRGVFRMTRVPRGGINVKVSKKGQVVGTGTAVLPPNLTSTRNVNVVITLPPAPPAK